MMSANCMRFAKAFLIGLLLLGGGVIHAADIDQAKRQGLVGERADGYVGLVDESAPAEVRRLVADINAKRKAEYQRIAQENDLEMAQVQALAGRKAIEKTQPGGWILVNGGWQQK
jgi:uncharacterized protein YdbL (DUF1318 family)